MASARRFFDCPVADAMIVGLERTGLSGSWREEGGSIGGFCRNIEEGSRVLKVNCYRPKV